MNKINQQRLLERFLRYVQVDTTADDHATTYPSSSGQLDLGKLIAGELRELGLRDVQHSKFGIVTATVPATTKKRVPVVAFNAHLDTSPETTGKGVKPQVLRNFAGGDIVLPANREQVIRVAANPELKALLGKTIITSDGTTLLGADDKAGLAVIVETAAYLMENPDVEHGPLRVCFTCDEEIGHGVDHVNLAELGAQVCYTLDGQGAGDIDVETFSADLAVVKVRGVNIHPSIGKGRMVNAVRGAANFLDRLPRGMLSPETTDGREGFVHPYHLEGGVAEVTIRIILRDFETANLEAEAQLLREAAASTENEIPGLAIDVTITPQYRNMADGLAKEPRAVEFAKLAMERLGRTPNLTIIRGGTDGSRFTELGLPTPNLSTGEHNPHSPLEWSCLEEMEAAAEVLVELARVWAEKA